jgi:hypothetical protein
VLLVNGLDQKQKMVVGPIQMGYLQERREFDVVNPPAITQKIETFFISCDRTYTRQKGDLLHP